MAAGPVPGGLPGTASPPGRGGSLLPLSGSGAGVPERGGGAGSGGPRLLPFPQGRSSAEHHRGAWGGVQGEPLCVVGGGRVCVRRLARRGRDVRAKYPCGSV